MTENFRTFNTGQIPPWHVNDYAHATRPNRQNDILFNKLKLYAKASASLHVSNYFL